MENFRERLEKRGVTFEQFIFQVIIVLIGVYLAILIGNIETKNENRSNVGIILREIMEQLEADRTQFAEVIQTQRKVISACEDLARIISDPASPEVRMIDSLYYGPLTDNKTAFPLYSAFHSLVSSGLIEHISDQELVIDIISLYERDYDRLIYNGELFDRAYQSNWNPNFLRYYDLTDRMIIARDHIDMAHFRNSTLDFRKICHFYINLVEEMMGKSEKLHESIGQYLE